MHKLLRRYRYSIILLQQLVKTDFRLRYQGSVLGYAWSLLRPLFLFAILFVVFSKFLRVGDAIPHYPVYLLIGIVLWNFFVEVTTGNVAAVVSKGDLIRKLNFPRYIIVLAGCVSAVINLCLNFIIIGIFMVIFGTSISWEFVALIPFLLLQLTIMALGLAFALSALFVKFRDVGYIWEVFIQAAFYATPILYPLSVAPETVQKYLLLNPVGQVIQDVRHILVTPETTVVSDLWSPLVWVVPIGITLALAVAGALYFRRQSKYFAEEV
jgi:ABC-2 type transport system permease protein